MATAKDSLKLIPEQVHLANDVAANIFTACSTCCRMAGVIHADGFECPHPLGDDGNKPVCSVPIIAADVYAFRGGANKDLSKYDYAYIESMIKKPDLLPVKGAAKVPITTLDTPTETAP